MLARKTKTFVYKNCSFHKGKGELKDLLAEAVHNLKSVGKRRQSMVPGTDDAAWLVIAQKKVDPAFFFGLLIHYTPGMAPSFIIDDDRAENLAVEHLTPPKTNDGKDRQLLESMLFFGVTGNHLVMMQSLALRSLQLERHLQWLLHHSQVLEGDDTLRLTDQMPKKTRQQLAKAPVKKVMIGGDLSAPAIVGGEDDGEDAEAVAETRPSTRLVPKSLALRSTAGSNHVLDLLKSLVSESGQAKLNLDDIQGANIEYSLEIRYKRETTDDGEKFMRRLGTALRHAEGVETEIKLKGGGSIKGDDLRLSGPVTIQTRDGVPNPDEVFEAMREWLLTKVKSGDIEA